MQITTAILLAEGMFIRPNCPVLGDPCNTWEDSVCMYSSAHLALYSGNDQRSGAATQFLQLRPDSTSRFLPCVSQAQFKRRRPPGRRVVGSPRRLLPPRLRQGSRPLSRRTSNNGMSRNGTRGNRVPRSGRGGLSAPPYRRDHHPPSTGTETCPAAMIAPNDQPASVSQITAKT